MTKEEAVRHPAYHDAIRQARWLAERYPGTTWRVLHDGKRIYVRGSREDAPDSWVCVYVAQEQ